MPAWAFFVVGVVAGQVALVAMLAAFLAAVGVAAALYGGAP